LRASTVSLAPIDEAATVAASVGSMATMPINANTPVP
jgi:hypothetical protein